MIDLQLPLGIVEITHTEKMLEQELLRTLAEVFELRRGDRLQCLKYLFSEFRAYISVKDRSCSCADNELHLPGARSGEPAVLMRRGGERRAEILEQRRAALRLLSDRKLFQEWRRPQHFAEAVASG